MMRKIEINKSVTEQLKKKAKLRNKEIKILKKISVISSSYNEKLLEVGGNSVYWNVYEVEFFKMLIDSEELKEGETILNTKINLYQDLLSKKKAHLLSIMSNKKVYSSDIENENTLKILIRFDIIMKATGLYLCHDTPPNVLRGFFINDNLPVPIKSFEFNLSETSEPELACKIWELLKQNGACLTEWEQFINEIE